MVGEIVAGLLLGATALARLPGNPSDNLFPAGTMPYLKAIAALGLVLFMFIVGLELDLSIVRGQERLAGTISLSSIALPFGGGVLLGLALYATHHPPNPAQSKTTFALFIGAAMSITAFPVLARILTDRGMLRTPLGSLSLASAAVDDVVAWTLLAVVVALAGHVKGAAAEPQWHIWLTIPYLVAMALVIRPMLGQAIKRFNVVGRLTPDLLAVVLVGLLLSAYVTDWLGIHYIFGAFLFGAVMPRADAAEMSHQILERLEQVSVLLLLPVFFVVTGLNVDFGKLGPHWAWQLPAVLAVAIGGKFIGAFGAARLQRVPRSRAGAIGVLMNTRGLTEIVILTVGQDKKILDPQLFSLLVLMAVVTTIMTGPLFRLVYSDRRLARDIAEAERAALGLPEAYRVLVAISDLGNESLVLAARDLIALERPCELVIAHVRPLARPALEVGSGLSIELSEFAESAERLEALREAAGTDQITAVTLVRMSDDSAAEIAAMCRATDADVAVIDETLDRAVVAANTTCIVVSAESSLPTGRAAVRVLLDVGADTDAATEVAVRLARSCSSELLVGTMAARANKLGTSVVAAAGRAGLAAQNDDGTRRLAVVVAPVGVATPGDLVHLRVSANQDRDVLAVDQMIGALTSESARRR